MSGIQVRRSGLLLLLVTMCAGRGSGQALQLPLLHLTANNINVAACQAYIDSKPVEMSNSQEALAALGIQGTGSWAVGTSEEGKTRQFLVALKAPMIVGALLVQANAECKYLVAGEAMPADHLAAKWTDCTFPAHQSRWKLSTLPLDTSVQAFLITLNRTGYNWDRFSLLRLFAPRLYNLTPDGTANGEAEYINVGNLHAPIPCIAANITRGAGVWQSAGPDSEGHIAHTVISQTFPTWFVVSWDTPHEVCAIRLESDFTKFSVSSFNGAAGINPAVGSDDDWTDLQCSKIDDGNSQWILFNPVMTRGIKFLVTQSDDSRFARIDGLHVYTDLQAKPVPVRQIIENRPPCTFTCTLPTDGYITAVIDDQQGHRVRNLTALEQHKAGPCTLGWDLKNDAGQMVPVGAYHWKVIFNPGLKLNYEMTPYPNIGDTTPDNSAWLNGASGPGGWLADHSAPRCVCTVGDRVFIGAPCSESGVSLIECDLTGKKLWGHSNMIAWTGPTYMTSDGKALYCSPLVDGTDYVWRFSLPDLKMDTMLQVDATATRYRGIRGMAARDGKLYLSINAGTDYLENAATPADVDLNTCVPRYAVPPKTNKLDEPDPRNDFLRLFRLTGTPPGNKGLVYLEATKNRRVRQHIVLSFTHPVPIGSLVFPLPNDPKLEVRISVLKADSVPPLLPRKDSQWTEIWKGNGPGWTVVAAPPDTLTRAVRISFDHGQTDVEDEGQDQFGLDPDVTQNDTFVTAPAWQAKLDGMKILRRRFKNLFATAKVSVNSGVVSPTGEWDAQRTEPLTTTNPGIYMMQWDKPETIRGLAIKEIDGRRTEIDAWTGPAGVPVDMNDTKNWTHIARYDQKLRYYYQPDPNNNTTARYMDGYVDFGREVTTRALRLRVVEQWMWRAQDRAGDVGVRLDRGGQTLDPTRCRIYGVAPLEYLGGESPVDPLTTERMEVYDTQTAKLEKEWSLPGGGELAFDPVGGLYAISMGQVVSFDTTTGKIAPLKLDVKDASAITFDRLGNLYVFDDAPDQRVVKVFSTTGKYLRTIGTPGGRVVGPWDPTRFTSSPGIPVDLAVDEHDQLWVVESDFIPKRVSVWGTDGTFKKDLLGNTAYGGGGCLDPYDKTKVFYGPMEFALNWQTGATKLKGITWLGDSPAGEMPIQVNGRQYMVTRPMFGRQSVAVVYLYEHGILKRVAAMGQAGSFAPLRTPEVLDKLGKTPIGDCTFIWSDLNGDGVVQANEVEFFDNSTRFDAPGRFENTLSIDAGGAYRYEVTGFTPSGVPIYKRVTKPLNGNLLKLNNGNWFTLWDAPERVVNSAGATVWTYPSEPWGVQALNSAKPYSPDQVVAEFDVIGHDVASAGDLGEFLVTDGNTGDWHIWTADGLLAGRLFCDLRAPGTLPWSMPEHERGLDLSGVTVGQEHFSGDFCRTADNNYYAVAGHNHISIVKVEGMNKFVREQGNLNVTAPMEQQAVAWNQHQLSRTVYDAAKLIVCNRSQGVTVDGDPGDWDKFNAHLEDHDVSFGMSYDDKNLYVCYVAKNCGPMKNTGNDWRRLFKTGAAVDLQIGADPNAPVNRTSPAPGDERLLMTVVNGKPIAVLYQPNAPGSNPGEGWETHTMVFSATFDRVVQVPEVKIAVGAVENGYCLEAAIPLKTLGLTIKYGMQLKMDWGILMSGPDGTEVLQRLYWANPLTAIISDEAAEAALHPDLWGTVRFLGRGNIGTAPDDMPDLL